MFDLETLPREVRITAKKLLFSCELVVSSQVSNSELVFSGEGSLRVGPKKSEISLQSFYDLEGHQPRLLRHRIEVPGFGVDDRNHEVTHNFESIGALFFIEDEIRKGRTEFDLEVLAGSKCRPLSVVGDGENYSLTDEKGRTTNLVVKSDHSILQFKLGELKIQFTGRLT